MLIQAAMSDDRAINAVGRIEQALARIEAAAKAPKPQTDNEELRRLREVHQALRGKVEGAISDIDRMLAARERV
jgi:hypothetical protein